ncbi:SAM-dependent methyltransferase [Chloroflexota bacterium]
MTETQTLNAVSLETLHNLSQRPTLYDPGEPQFWTDPHIAKMLLEAHLDPNFEAASRNPATIDATVNWLLDTLKLEPSAAWLDIGCGPGLYTSRLAQRGLQVTGVDYSEGSLAYARQSANEQNLTIAYRYQNYLTLEDENQYDVVSLIYGDFCPLPPEDRATLLDRIHRALKPGGRFVFDLSTPQHHIRNIQPEGWSVEPTSGFWRAEPHLMLESGHIYPEDIFLKQIAVIVPDGTITVYRFWFQDYTPERITDELVAHGFSMISHWGDLTGTPYTPDGEWLGVIAEQI